MAGDQSPGTVSNEYGNKLLNGEGLLHLVGTIKTEISNAGGGGGGGATYTAGNGISIDANDSINVKYNFDNAILNYWIKKTTSGNIYQTATSRENFIELLRAGKWVIPNQSYSSVITPAELGINTGNQAAKTLNITTGVWSSGAWLVSTSYCYFLINDWFVRVSYSSLNNLDVSKLLFRPKGTYFNTKTIGGQIDELATGKQDTLTAGTGISITNGVISVNLTNAESESF